MIEQTNGTYVLVKDHEEAKRVRRHYCSTGFTPRSNCMNGWGDIKDFAVVAVDGHVDYYFRDEVPEHFIQVSLKGLFEADRQKETPTPPTKFSKRRFYLDGEEMYLFAKNNPDGVTTIYDDDGLILCAFDRNEKENMMDAMIDLYNSEGVEEPTEKEIGMIKDANNYWESDWG